jgi:hypothetical protein
MNISALSYGFFSSPLAAGLIVTACGSVMGILAVLIRIAMRFAVMDADIKGLREDIRNLADDKDVLRWSTIRVDPTGRWRKRG